MWSNGWFKSVRYWCILLKSHFKDGGTGVSTPSTIGPASLYNPSCGAVRQVWRMTNYSWAGKDIVYFYLVKYIWTPSSYPPVHSPPATCTYFRWFMIARLEEYTLLQLTLKTGKFLTSERNIFNASTKRNYFKLSPFNIQRRIFIWCLIVSDGVCCLAPLNTQFCHHKSFSMFFLWQFSLGKKK